MQAILSFLTEIFSQPAFLMGLIAFVGLVALRSPGNKLLTGTLKPILGYLMLSAGAGVIVANLNPLGGIIEAGFNIRGVIPNNEAIVSVAQKMLGVETMSILLLGFIFNLIIARCTKYKYIFLTGHHSFFLACLFSAVLQAAEFQGWMLILIGGFLLGSWSAISPAIGQRYTRQVTEDGGIAMGHFGSLGYYLSAWIASRTGNPANSLRRYRNFRKVGLSARYHGHHRYRDVCYLLCLQRCRRVGVPEHHHRPKHADLLGADRSAVRRWRSHCL